MLDQADGFHNIDIDDDWPDEPSPDDLRTFFAVTREPDETLPATATRDAETATATGKTTGEACDDPHRLARLVKGKLSYYRFYRGDGYLWDGIAYNKIDDDETSAALNREIKTEFDRVYQWQLRNPNENEKPPKCKKVTRSLRVNVRDILQSESLVPSAMELPCWLNNTSNGWPAESCVVAANGIMPIEAPDVLLPPNPDLFTVNCLPFNIDRNADCPRWKAFLSDIWPDDQQSIETLQESMGYLLTTKTDLQKMFLFVGPKRSGKGTISKVIRGLVGSKNVVAPTLGSLASDFGLEPLLGKTVAIIGDARLSGRVDSSITTERILSITGEDLQTVNRKHKTSVTTRLPIRFVVNSNELPKLNDASATLPSRMVLFRMRNSFYGREDHKLDEKLMAECPGILNWAIDGLQRLNERGYLVQPESSTDLIKDLETLSSPTAMFVDDCCKLGTGEDFKIEVKELYESYRNWCIERGQQPRNQQTFGRDLRAAAPNIECKQGRDLGVRVRNYLNIRLAKASDKDDDDDGKIGSYGKIDCGF